MKEFLKRLWNKFRRKCIKLLGGYIIMPEVKVIPQEVDVTTLHSQVVIDRLFIRSTPEYVDRVCKSAYATLYKNLLEVVKESGAITIKQTTDDYTNEQVIIATLKVVTPRLN